MRRILALTLMAVLFLGWGACPGLGEFFVVPVPAGVGTRINSLPCSITQPGFYYLSKNLIGWYGMGDAITISSDNVTLDLMGFEIEGKYSGSGVLISYGSPWPVTNVEIRNGTIRNFEKGIYTQNANDTCHRIINIRFLGNTTGIWLNGYGHMIKGCTLNGNNTAISCSASLVIQNLVVNAFTAIISGTGNKLYDNTF